MITEKIEVSNEILASGGFADVRKGTYLNTLVAVKTMRVDEQDVSMRLREVRIYRCFFFQIFGRDSDVRSPAILRRGRALEYPFPPEHLETRWGSGRHE